MTHITQHQIDRICEMRERGLSYGQIGIAVGCKPGTVNWHCLRLAIESPRQSKIGLRRTTIYRRDGVIVRAFSPSDDRKILSLSLQGVKASDIAERLDRATSSIRNRLMTLARIDARRELAS